MQSVVVGDLHGNVLLYELLFRVADLWKFTSIFITGDLAPNSLNGRPPIVENLMEGDQGVSVQRDFFVKQFIPLCSTFLLRHRHSDIYVIMGNDDRRVNEPLLEEFDEKTPNFHLLNDRLVVLRDSQQKQAFFPGEVPLLLVAGYPYVPPGGYMLMDWVKYENRVKLRPMGMDSTVDIYDAGVSTDVRGHSSTIADDRPPSSLYLLTARAGGRRGLDNLGGQPQSANSCRFLPLKGSGEGEGGVKREQGQKK